MTKRRTIEESEIPWDDARREQIRAELSAFSDLVDEWVQRARGAGLKLILSRRQDTKAGVGTGPFSKIGEIDQSLEDVERTLRAQRPYGRWGIKAYIPGQAGIVSSIEFSLGDPPDVDVNPVAPEGSDVKARLAEAVDELRTAKVISVLGREEAVKQPDQLGTIKAIGEIMGAGKGNPEVAAIIQTQGAQVTELMRMLVSKKDSPGLGTQLLGAIAPALPGLAEMAAERWFSGGTTISDASDVGKLDWNGWLKVAMHQVISNNPEMIQRILTQLAGAATGHPVALPPIPGEKGATSMPASERMSAELLALLGAAIEYFKGEEFDPSVGYVMLLDVIRAAGGNTDREQDGNDVDGLLAPLPTPYLSAKLRLLDTRLADPKILENIKRVAAWDREQGEPEVPEKTA